MSENKETKQAVNKLMVDDYDIIVTGKSEKPYYQIKYHEVGSEPDKYDVGFGSYILGNVFEYRDEYFEVVPEDDKKKEVTNEQLMYHLKEVEIAQGCLANASATLFSLIHARRKKLELDKSEERIIRSGLNALLMCTNNMSEISGLNERTKEVVDKVEAHEIKDADDLLDFLKEILK